MSSITNLSFVPLDDGFGILKFQDYQFNCHYRDKKYSGFMVVTTDCIYIETITDPTKTTHLPCGDGELHNNKKTIDFLLDKSNVYNMNDQNVRLNDVKTFIQEWIEKTFYIGSI